MIGFEPMPATGRERLEYLAHASVSHVAAGEASRLIWLFRTMRLALSTLSMDPQLAWDCRTMFVIRRVNRAEFTGGSNS